ncbi:hypothetical protein RN001_003357 [Aquatica leii]|uniref:Glycoside hydrolase family 31 n=1 Tax=Aquatica leii TaxID=1421715 RepID=A0AAN7SDX5_9COLE|nr:hypothetical protein RN001_003357 [Aquatica leii]
MREILMDMKNTSLNKQGVLQQLSFKMSGKAPFLATLLLFNIFLTQGENLIQITNDGVSLSIKPESGRLQLTLSNGVTPSLTGEIGVNLTQKLVPCVGVNNCFEAGDVRLHINTHIQYGFTIFWTSNNIATVFEDCFNLEQHHWFGGPERFYQDWPIEKLTLTNFANVLQEDQWGAVVEPYWLNSAGAYIFVNEKVPLFINQNSITSKNKVCFSAKVTSPYSPQRQRVILQYSIVAKDDARAAHLHAVKTFLGKPTGHPNFKMIERPIWSTWARYKRDVNDSVVREFTKEIADHGYSDGQLEIDDDWEDCYGALSFRASKFSGIDETVAYIKSLNFRVTLWAHPFINLDCKKHLESARKYGFLVKDLNGSDLTQWWNSNSKQATYLDFSNLEVQEWFIERLQALQKNHGIDSFKFDAGETTWAPTISKLYGDVETTPNSLSADYVRTCAQFGDLVEVRSAWKTQDLPIYVRMIDKDSNWGNNNGLYTLLTTLMQMNLNGYSMVLPDMVGGNGYQGAPSAELFIRWLEANVFMPSIQFSYVPWDYQDQSIDVSAISRKFINLHQKYASYIIKQMQNSIDKGFPVNAPIWWIAPNDQKALGVDTEFVLGENILVAPVITENARSRDVYLPEGKWVDGNNRKVYVGPVELINYNAPIDVLPYFVRKDSDADI